ncbi:MAG: toll/interleukin-1 receptor domain-containing protein [Gammaproteobacteria bacterium]
MTAIFISHNSNDAREAVALKRWLADNGWDDVFLDIDAKDGLSPGERWKDALKNAADRCEAVLCLVSPTWLASAECKLEYRYAETLRKHLFLAIVKPSNPQELPPDWQWCPLFGDGAQTTIRFDFREAPTECTFLTDGLERLNGCSFCRCAAV